MEHKEKLEELNSASLQKFEDYVKTKSDIKEEDHAKLHQAKDEWQAVWNKLVEAMIVLERIEI